MSSSRQHPYRLALLVLGALLPLFLASSVAHAQDVKAQAKQHFSAGEARFKAGDYRAAITEFAAADSLVPSPILSYNIGLCHERLGEDELAVQRYRDYLGRRPDASNRAQVEERIQQAEQRIAARKAPAPAPIGPPAPTPAPIGPPAPQPAVQPAPPVEGPAAPRPPGEGPAAPSAPPSTGGGAPIDDGLAKRLPPRAQPSGDLGALSASTRGDAEAAPSPATAPQTLPGPTSPVENEKHSSNARPLYKEWWFWAVVGVSAIIVIDMASGSSSNTKMGATPSGAVLLRF